MKDTFYFPHDYNARSDSRIKRLLYKHGILGYGVFWAIVEDLYINANAIPLDYEGIAYDLRLDVDIIRSIINDYDLFVLNAGIISSNSVQRRLNERIERSGKAKESAKKRWSKVDSNANAIRTHTESNAIKERKGKESKEKEEEKENKEKALPVENVPFHQSVEENLKNLLQPSGLPPDGILKVLSEESEAMIESICMSKKISREECQRAIRKFVKDKKIIGHRSESDTDARSHFLRWMKNWDIISKEEQQESMAATGRKRVYLNDKYQTHDN